VSELRQDGLTGRLVLVAPGRASRPHTNAPDGAAPSSGPATCPFCPGHEDQTPPEVYRTGAGAPETPGWRVRVVPNLYPIVGPDAAPGATGVHEVVVLSPAHDHPFALLSDEEAIEVAEVLRERARHHAAAGRRHVQVLINSGRPAGASIAHPHAQLLALDIVPPAVQAAEARFVKSDVLRADADDALARDLVIVAGDDRHAPAWCPWAGSSPWAVRIATRDGGPRFEEAPDHQLHAVTRTLRRVLGVLASDLGDPAYNVVVQNAPAGKPAEWSRWYVEVIPRVSYVAGFELGTGLYVNSVAPEWAAGQYRETLS
jgi:UDPglucose--hexose-1-phosphate uridylyltransferase